MFKSAQVEECFKNLIGWKNHYDLTEIPALAETTTASESNEYFQDFHPALRLDIIQASLPQNRELEEYLLEQRSNGITQLLNDVIKERKYQGYAKKTLATETLLHGYGWAKDTIINEGRFVGFRITPTNQTGLSISLKKIGFQFTMAQTDLKIYLYHSSKFNPLQTFNLTTDQGMDWNWLSQEIEMVAESEDISGGSYIIGYYQDDINGQAINFTDFNWKNGPCGTCDGGVKRNRWRKFNEYASVLPIYVPSASLNTERTGFDFRDSFVNYDRSFGMNLRISAECDLTNFFCEHKFSLKYALALKVAYLVLKDIQFSLQINTIEEEIKSMIIRDLEGDKDTNYINIVDQLKEEIKGLNFDHSGLSMPCLPCTNKNAPKYGVA